MAKSGTWRAAVLLGAVWAVLVAAAPAAKAVPVDQEVAVDESPSPIADEGRTASTPPGPEGVGVPGSLDDTFGGDGQVELNPTAGDDYARDVALQQDGRIVTAGRHGRFGGQFGIARFLADGSPDPSFSGNGWTSTNFGPDYDLAYAVAVQPDGKIVAAGYAAPGGFALARYQTNGALDPTFSGDGKVVTHLPAGFEFAAGLAIQPDGKLVLVGGIGGHGGQFAVLRYRSNGTLDPTFSGNGWAVTNITGGDDWAWDVALQPDGRIVAGGIANGGRDDSNFQPVVMRYNPNGSVDTTFSGDGRIIPRLSQSSVVTAVQIQPDGGIVLAGQLGRDTTTAFALWRLTSGGALDSQFSQDGKMVYDFGSGRNWAADVALQPDGGIVAVGTGPGGRGQFAAIRLLSNGDLDGTFGTGGTVRTNVTAEFDVAFGVALQPDGMIVAAGGSNGAAGRVALVRYSG